MEKPIVIASSSHDQSTVEPVISILESRGVEVVTYKTDRVLASLDNFHVNLDASGELEMDYNGTNISPQAVGALWYRKIAAFSIASAEGQIAKQQYINNEVRALHDTIWALYPDGRWLNSPANIAKADRKLGQLMVAHDIGFSIPVTNIDSIWEPLTAQFLAVDESKMVIKMMRGVISEGDTLKGMYSSVLDRGNIQHLQSIANPFPGIYQNYIPKAKEWRVTVVKDSVFPVAIYTDESAKDDWRRLQMTSAVRFEHEKLPDDVDQKCIDYLAAMSLRYGAFDFIEKPDGEVVFLECNPNGQYGWLEEELNLAISESIADELTTISSQSS